MINPKELMLGNWVYLNESSEYPMQVIDISQDMIYLDFEGNEGDSFECRMEDICPIPLTEEMLKNNGFIVRQYPLHGKIYEYHGEYHYFQLPFVDCCFKCSFAGVIYVIKYVHQLQNILTIAGIEIEFKI